jgi:hypothetical protein
LRIGLLFRGDRTVDPFSTPGAERLAPLVVALQRLGVTVEPVVYEDEALENVHAQIAKLDGVLVWVNPIQDGATRAVLEGTTRSCCVRSTSAPSAPSLSKALKSWPALPSRARRGGTCFLGATRYEFRVKMRLNVAFGPLMLV